jgi:hypothetical protein
LLCSRCSEPIRPIVALDIDGTMGDYHNHFIRFALGYMGMDLTMANIIGATYDGGVSMSTWFCHKFETDIRTYRDIKLAYRQGAQKRNMRARTWASDLTHHLMNRAEIWLTTTRPYLRLDGVDPDTRFWLHHNSIYYDHLLYHEQKYTVLANRVSPSRVVAVVDDLREDLEDAGVHFGEDSCIMYRSSFNKADWEQYEGRLAHEGQSLRTMIDRRIDDWYERYGSHGVSEESRSKAEAARTPLEGSHNIGRR